MRTRKHSDIGNIKKYMEAMLYTQFEWLAIIYSSKSQLVCAENPNILIDNLRNQHQCPLYMPTLTKVTMIGRTIILEFSFLKRVYLQ